jgi:hypothetical protein
MHLTIIPFATLQPMLKLRKEVRSSKLINGQSVSQYVCIEHPCGTRDQVLLPFGTLLSEICGLVSVGRPLWREDGSAICSVITQLSESRRIRNHTLLSHLQLPQPGGPGSQKQGGPVIPPGTGLRLRNECIHWLYQRWRTMLKVEITGICFLLLKCINTFIYIPEFVCYFCL